MSGEGGTPGQAASPLLCDNREVMDALMQAINGPGKFLNRAPLESMASWQRRAIVEHVAPLIINHADEHRDDRTPLGIAVRALRTIAWGTTPELEPIDPSVVADKALAEMRVDEEAAADYTAQPQPAPGDDAALYADLVRKAHDGRQQHTAPRWAARDKLEATFRANWGLHPNDFRIKYEPARDAVMAAADAYAQAAVAGRQPQPAPDECSCRHHRGRHRPGGGRCAVRGCHCDSYDPPAERQPQDADGEAHAACADIGVVQDQLDVVYRERARLIAFLAAVYPSEIIEQPGKFADERPVIFVDTPAGQLSWHLSRNDLHLFDHVRKFIDGEQHWDGHTTDEKYERLATLIPHALDIRHEQPGAQPAPELAAAMAESRKVQDILAGILRNATKGGAGWNIRIGQVAIARAWAATREPVPQELRRFL